MPKDTKPKKPKITAKQEGGDDGYCYVIRVDGKEFVNGLTKAEVPHYKKQALKEWEKKNENPMESRAVRALTQTWQAIGFDILQAYADEGDGNAEQVNIPRDEVIDAVRSCGFIGGYPEMYGNDKEAVQWLEAQTDKEQDRICKKAFPLTRYGA